jgi:spore germination protein YaaH
MSVAGLMKSADMKVIGWIPYWDQQNAFKSFSKHVDKFDFISVFWYRIDPNGNLTTYADAEEDQEIINFAKKNNVKVLALVANLPDHNEGEEWDAQRVDKVIASSEARKKHIADLISLVEAKNFDGIDIDYEALKRQQRENFSLFIEELAQELHKRDKVLGVAIHPKTGEYKPEEDNGSQAQDLKRISRVADQLYYMTYLEYGTFSPPGPPGSIGWIEKVVRYSLEELAIPREKIFMGIGLMGVRWKDKGNGDYIGDKDDVQYQEALTLAQKEKLTPLWDHASRTPYLEYEENNTKYVLWFENKDSIMQRFELAERLSVNGIAFWRLGGEDNAIWEGVSR